jgi:TatD DNase family protein
MIPLVDSHCHLNRLDLNLFENSLSHALDVARKAGVEHFLTVSVELEDFEELKNIALQHKDVSYSIGWHPTSVTKKNIVPLLLDAGSHSLCVAIGETGLDYYHLDEHQTIEIQQDVFRQHIHVAKELKKPLIIHTRQSAEDTIKILREESANEVGGVMHCFTEDWDIAKKALDLGFMISLSGIVTFKNAHIVHDVAKKTPLESLLIETDCPYLAPVPFRGKPNHPGLVKYVAEMIAQLKGIQFEEVAEQTTQNFYRYFFRS